MTAKQFMTETSNMTFIKIEASLKHYPTIQNSSDLYTIHLYTFAYYYISNNFHRIIKNLVILLNLQRQMHKLDMNNNAIILMYQMPHFLFFLFLLNY